MRYRVTHQTTYEYSEAVTLCHNEVRMTPRGERGQTCARSVVEIIPSPAYMTSRLDHFGNQVHYFDVEQPHDVLKVTVTSDCETNRGNEPAVASPTCQAVRQAFRDRGAHLHEPDLKQFVFPSARASISNEIQRYARATLVDSRALLDAVEELNHRIFAEFTYDPTATHVESPLEQVLSSRRGVCQDFAHLAVAALRSFGLPAAYVSGYLETQPAPGAPKLRGVDASHAWFSVYIPGSGWHDFDPTNDKSPDSRYIVVARGRDYTDVTPLKGVVFGGGNMSLAVAVDVLEQP